MPRRERRRDAGQLKQSLIKHAGWPQTLPCITCKQPHRATWRGHRMCAPCRARAARLDIGPEAAAWWS